MQRRPGSDQGAKTTQRDEPAQDTAPALAHALAHSRTRQGQPHPRAHGPCTTITRPSLVPRPSSLPSPGTSTHSYLHFIALAFLYLYLHPALFLPLLFISPDPVRFLDISCSFSSEPFRLIIFTYFLFNTNITGSGSHLHHAHRPTTQSTPATHRVPKVTT